MAFQAFTYGEDAVEATSQSANNVAILLALGSNKCACYLISYLLGELIHICLSPNIFWQICGPSRFREVRTSIRNEEYKMHFFSEYLLHFSSCHAKSARRPSIATLATAGGVGRGRRRPTLYGHAAASVVLVDYQSASSHFLYLGSLRSR